MVKEYCYVTCLMEADCDLHVNIIFLQPSNGWCQFCSFLFWRKRPISDQVAKRWYGGLFIWTLLLCCPESKCINFNIILFFFACCQFNLLNFLSYRLHIHFLFHLTKLEILNIMMEIFKLQDLTISNLWMFAGMLSSRIRTFHPRLDITI